MKQKKLCLLTVVFIATVALSSGQRVWADLTAAEFRDAFNDMSGDGKGFHFINESFVPGDTSEENINPPGLVVLYNDPAYHFSEEFFSAYSGSTSTMSTFCIQPSIPIRSNGTLVNLGKKGFSGMLVYENDKTFTCDINGNPQYLTVGAAYLYKAFITGDLQRAGITNPTEIGRAIRYWMDDSLQYNENMFMSWLFGLPAEVWSMWEEDYDPGANYDFMDGYQVFVMSVTDELLWNESLGSYGKHSQDFLFIRSIEPAPEPNHAPEPVTIIFWTLGAAGAIGYARKRSRMSKQAVS